MNLPAPFRSIPRFGVMSSVALGWLGQASAPDVNCIAPSTTITLTHRVK